LNPEEIQQLSVSREDWCQRTGPLCVRQGRN